MYVEMHADRAAEVRHEPHPSQKAFAWGERCRPDEPKTGDPPQSSEAAGNSPILGVISDPDKSPCLGLLRTGNADSLDEVARLAEQVAEPALRDGPCGEVVAYARRGLLPPGWEATAQRAARWCHRNGWGDEHDLLAAGIDGLWRAASSPEVAAGAVGDPGRWAESFMWTRFRRASWALRHQPLRNAAVHRRTFAWDPDVMAQTVADRRGGVEPPARDHEAFWETVCAALTPKQAETVTAVYRYGGSAAGHARDAGRSPAMVRDSLESGLRRIRWKLGDKLDPAAAKGGAT